MYETATVGADVTPTWHVWKDRGVLCEVLIWECYLINNLVVMNSNCEIISQKSQIQCPRDVVTWREEVPIVCVVDGRQISVVCPRRGLLPYIEVGIRRGSLLRHMDVIGACNPVRFLLTTHLVNVAFFLYFLFLFSFRLHLVQICFCIDWNCMVVKRSGYYISVTLALLITSMDRREHTVILDRGWIEI